MRHPARAGPRSDDGCETVLPEKETAGVHDRELMACNATYRPQCQPKIPSTCHVSSVQNLIYGHTYLVYWPAMNGIASGRREFLHFLASSPLLAMAQDPPGAAVTSPKDALNVMDFEALAHKALPPAHWGYLTSGVDDDLTLRMNREAMGHF